jgi:hypothetical protein
METNTETTATTPSKPVKASKAPKKGVSKTGAKLVKKAAPKVASKPDADGKVALKTICAKLDIEPRLARRKLRNAELAFHDHRDRWNFTKAQAEKVTEILRA